VSELGSFAESDLTGNDFWQAKNVMIVICKK
jgi:hypothetical protein